MDSPLDPVRELIESGPLAHLVTINADGEAGSPVGHGWSPPVRIGVEPQPQADGSAGRWRIWIRDDDGWQTLISDCGAEEATAWLGLMVFSAEDKEGVRAALEDLLARRPAV